MKKSCYDYALLLLSYSGRSEKELRERLHVRNYEDKDIAEAVNKLKHYGLIDDRAYVENFLKSQTQKLKGIRLVKMNLLNKGVPVDIIKDILGEENQEEELEKAKRLAVKSKFLLKKKRVVSDARRLAGYLSGRGFSNTVVGMVVKMYFKEDCDLPELE